MKSFLKTLASVLMVITAGGLMACRGSNGTPVQPTSNDSSDSDSVQPTTYNVSIPATISGDGTFADDKFVYIYNSTTGKVLLIDSIWDYERQCYCGALNLTDISADGKKCTIRGTLVGNISPNDSLVLLYDIDKPSAISSYCTFGYYCLDAAATKYNGAMAVATADNYDNDSMLTTKAAAVFQPLQSWFQFKFADENGKPLSVASLVITSDNYIFTEEYRPFSPENNGYCTNEIYITPKSPTDDYIYADIRFGERCTDADTLTFTVTDAEGNDYKGTKPVPKGGFKKGKRYIEPTAIRLTKHITRVKPTIDWNNVSEEGPSPSSHRYEVAGRLIGIPEGSYEANFDSPSITISGKSDGYCFYMHHNPTATLNNLTAIYNDTGLNRFLDEGFINSNDDLHIIVNGTNSIVCKDSRQCIATQGSLKISGNGTLSVTVNDAAYKGLLGESNYNKSNNNSTDNLVDDNTGDVVVLKSKTKNGDGTWTFTYKVTNASH